MTGEKKVLVRYYTCDCDWISKYCDEHHQSTARIPVSIVNEYRLGGEES